MMAEYSACAAPAVGARALLPQSGDGGSYLERTLIDPGATWRRPLPEFVADLAPQGTPHTVLEDAREKHAKFRTRYGPTLLYGSHHFHALLDESGRLSVQETDPDRVDFRIRYHLEDAPDAAVRIPRITSGDGGFSYRFDADMPLVALDGPVFFGSPIEPDNFGMWLLNGLASARDYLARGAGETYLCWTRLDWERRMLAFLGIPEARLVEQKPWAVYGCPELTLHQYSKVDLVPTDTDKEVFRDIAARCGDVPAGSPARIFLSRRRVSEKFGQRRLIEEDALVAALEARGFAIVEPETLAFDAQVRLFRGARVVVGLGGAALFSTVFCRPGTAVVSIESTGGFAENHASLFAGMGLRYAFIFGQQDATDPTPVHKRWNLDVRRAVQHIVTFANS
jgi:capsular polysaccharide biosynthesis protein